MFGGETARGNGRKDSPLDLGEVGKISLSLPNNIPRPVSGI